MIKFTIPTAPRTKKNNQEIHYRGKKGEKKIPFISQGKAYLEYESECQKLITGRYRLKINYPVNVKALYFMPKNGKVDITNLHSALHDILVKVGVLEDDNYKIVVSTDGSRVFVDEVNPRTEVEIEVAT